MGIVIINESTTKNPISLIGEMAGVCYGSDTSSKDKNYKRGLENLSNNHGRTMEYPQIYMILDGYSARVIREFYTHIGGAPTRLQASTRYIKYGEFDYIIPPAIAANRDARIQYEDAMSKIKNVYQTLEVLNIKKEDIANILPLGMATKVVVRTNLRNILDMCKQRQCNRAYWEFRNLMRDIIRALSEYSKEWETVFEMYGGPKCNFLGYCPEKFGCGKYPKKDELNTQQSQIGYAKTEAPAQLNKKITIWQRIKLFFSNIFNKK